ncbi:MAG: hypothetical protein A2162_01655 [Deltaproteobacteria bacterium RBG_13_52_11b]|nr:MAG: hypothetical protein A2162_01655 [Deltaproteobacteria bacterium RBG_13_52_11b]
MLRFPRNDNSLNQDLGFQYSIDIPCTFEYLLVERSGTLASVKAPPSPFPGANETFRQIIAIKRLAQTYREELRLARMNCTLRQEVLKELE